MARRGAGHDRRGQWVGDGHPRLGPDLDVSGPMRREPGRREACGWPGRRRRCGHGARPSGKGRRFRPRLDRSEALTDTGRSAATATSVAMIRCRPCPPAAPGEPTGSGPPTDSGRARRRPAQPPQGRGRLPRTPSRLDRDPRGGSSAPRPDPRRRRTPRARLSCGGQHGPPDACPRTPAGLDGDQHVVVPPYGPRPDPRHRRRRRMSCTGDPAGRHRCLDEVDPQGVVHDQTPVGRHVPDDLLVGVAHRRIGVVAEE